MRSYYDNGYDGGGYGRNGYDETKANNIEALASLGSVQEKDGKRYWMGIEVPDDIAPSLELLTSGLPAFIADKLNKGVYENALKLHAKISGKNKPWDTNSAHKFALGSAAVATAVVIGAQPGMTIIQAVKGRNKDRSETLANLKDIIDADKHYKDNEVVKTALENSHKVMTAGLKDAASQLPTVLVNGFFAFKNHKLLKEGTKDALATGRIEDFDSSTLETYNVDESTQKYVGGGAVIVNSLLKRNLSKDALEELKKPNAYKMIIELRDRITNGEVYKGTDITNQIVQIFQQNEVDRGRHEIGPALMDKFNPLAKQIGEAISNRELDAISLVNIVGGGKVINNRKFTTSEKLDDLLEYEIDHFGPREKKTLEELLSNHQDPKKVMQAIKDNLQNLKGDERAVFAALFSDDVLLKSGVKRRELPEMRGRSTKIFCEFIQAKAADISQKSPEELKAHNISEQQIQKVREFNELVASGDKKAIISAVRSTDESGENQIKEAVLTYGLNDKNFSWSAAIKSAKKDAAKIQPATSMVEAVNKSKQNGNGASLHA